MMTSKDLYNLLEVSPNATQEEIKESYRLIVSMLHPDKFPQDSKQWIRAHEKIQEINEAYCILKEPEQRVQYDRELSQRKVTFSSEQNQPFKPDIPNSVSTPREARPEPSPVLQPEAHVKPTEQASSGYGCARGLFGSLSVGCFVSILVVRVSDSANEIPTWTYISFAFVGLGFLLYFLMSWEKK